MRLAPPVNFMEQGPQAILLPSNIKFGNAIKFSDLMVLASASTFLF